MTPQSTILSTINTLGDLLGPVAKAAVPAATSAVALVVALVNWANTGTFNSVSVTSAVCSFVLAAVTLGVYLVRNKPASASVAPVAPAKK